MKKRLAKIHPWAALAVAIVSISTAVCLLIFVQQLPPYAPLIGATALLLGLGAFLVALSNKPTI